MVGLVPELVYEEHGEFGRVEAGRHLRQDRREGDEIAAKSKEPSKVEHLDSHGPALAFDLLIAL